MANVDNANGPATVSSGTRRKKRRSWKFYTVVATVFGAIVGAAVGAKKLWDSWSTFDEARVKLAELINPTSLNITLRKDNIGEAGIPGSTDRVFTVWVIAKKYSDKPAEKCAGRIYVQRFWREKEEDSPTYDFPTRPVHRMLKYRFVVTQPEWFAENMAARDIKFMLKCENYFSDELPLGGRTANLK